MAGNDSFDLLGLDFGAPASAAPLMMPVVLPPQEPQVAKTTTPLRFEEGYAPAHMSAATVVRNGHQADGATEEVARRFSVRCEGRWRIRNAPSLNSKVVGTVANGTIVVADDVPNMESQANFPDHAATMRMPDGTEVPPDQRVIHSITSLWVKVRRFETHDPMDVSEIKRDTSSGGALYCLRRNALGYGLYEIGIEPLDGPLVMPPDWLSSELRLDAQQAAADKTEDCSLTWKLLGAADSFSQFFSQGSVEDDCGITEGITCSARKRPEEMFEAKQRENLRKAAGTLKASVQKIVDKAKSKLAADADVTAALQKDLKRQFFRLRMSLAAAYAGSHGLVVSITPQNEDSPKGNPESPQTSREAQLTACREGIIAELEQFLERLTRVERQPGGSELNADLRVEIVSFSSRHSRDLDHYALNLGRGINIEGGYVTAESSHPAAPTASVQPQQSKPSGFVPMLAPPPPPSRGVGNAQLL